jgi:hypothetical protein
MGSCAYFLKAKFKNATAAKKACAKFNKFLAEAAEAYNYYPGDKSLISELEKKFPNVTEYLECTDEQWREGHIYLDFGQNDCAHVVDDEVWYGDGDVGHLNTWTPLTTWIQEKYGAVKAVWDNEDNGCGSLEGLQLFDYEHIVKDILKQKHLLPLLLNINKELDVMIGQAFTERKTKCAK